MTQYDQLIDRLIDLAIEEDIATGDVTTNSIIPAHSRAVAEMKMKADGVISGLAIAKRVYEKFEKDILWDAKVKDGDRVKKGDIILRIEASYRCLLLGERLSLNILQRMSGIATETARYVEELAGTHTQLLDTRKTAPGLRVLDKMAVKDGGATNHRMGLYDMAMIKDNHIKVAGGITNAVNAVRAHIPAGIKIEVETTNLAEVREDGRSGENHSRTGQNRSFRNYEYSPFKRSGSHRSRLYQRRCLNSLRNGFGHQYEYSKKLIS